MPSNLKQILNVNICMIRLIEDAYDLGYEHGLQLKYQNSFMTEELWDAYDEGYFDGEEECLKNLEKKTE